MSNRNGFSFVELLVALVLTGILLAGLTQVFAANISAFHTTAESSSLQRRNRWLLDKLSDDLKMAGHSDGIDITVPDWAEKPFMILPGGTTEAPSDTLQFFLNEPLSNCELSLLASSGATAFSAKSTSGSPLNLARGDYFIIKDGASTDVGFVESVDTKTGLIQITSEVDPFVRQFFAPGAGMLRAHAFGTKVTFLRPLQIVRYAIEERAMDPSSTATIPCLVRRSAPYTGVAIDWATASAVVVGENIAAFRADMSVDAGSTWARGESADWADVLEAANAKLDASNQISDNQMWFKRIPTVLRADITSRSAMARTEYSMTKKELAYRLQTQSLLVAPRNFAIPL